MNQNLNFRLGQAIRTRRITLGLSQSKLAKQIGTSYQMVQKYESGENQVSYPRLLELARAFGISVGDLVEESKGEQPVHTYSDREAVEMMKRFQLLDANTQKAVRLFVQRMAGEV